MAEQRCEGHDKHCALSLVLESVSQAVPFTMYKQVLLHAPSNGSQQGLNANTQTYTHIHTKLFTYIFVGSQQHAILFVSDVPLEDVMQAIP